MEASKVRQIARWIAFGALFSICLIPLVVVDGLYFPFITGKGFFFRIAVEAAVAAWAVLAVLDRAYRPRFSWLGGALLAFLGWMFLADLAAPNVLKAFWSNFERMEGWMLLLHLTGFFFAASAILGTEKKWRAWFLSSLGVSFFVALYALLQIFGELPIHQGSVRIDASFGNSAYLAVYFLFSVFVAGWLAVTEKDMRLRIALGALAVLEAGLLFYTETRGAILGLAGGLLIVAILIAFSKELRIRLVAGAVTALIVVAALGLYGARDSSFVEQSRILNRVTSISLADGATRFALWGMAFEGFKERPLLGWGQEGFNYVFNTHYDPALYQQEPWFDRAHNAFVDWLSAGGLPAFILYVSLFAFAFVYLWRSTHFSRTERVVLTAVLVGYACHNFFVFDNLYSYVYFFALLAFIDSKVARPVPLCEQAREVSSTAGVLYVPAIATAVFICVVWFVQVPHMRTATGLITAVSPSPGGLEENVAAFERLVLKPTFADQEIRERLVAFSATVVQSPSVPAAVQGRASALAVREMETIVARYPRDARLRLQLAYAYEVSGEYASAQREVEEALALSPRKQSIWIQLGQVKWNRDDLKGAREAFEAAYALSPQFLDLAAYAAAGAVITGDAKRADELLLSAYGSNPIDHQTLAAAYYLMRDWPRLVAYWKARAMALDASLQTQFSYAGALYAAGRSPEAIAVLNAIRAEHPEAADAAAAAITQIRTRAAGR